MASPIVELKRNVESYILQFIGFGIIEMKYKLFSRQILWKLNSEGKRRLNKWFDPATKSYRFRSPYEKGKFLVFIVFDTTFPCSS